MTLHDLFTAIVQNDVATLTIILLIPPVIGALSALVDALGAKEISQWIANFGIALGFAAFLIELAAISYSFGTLEINPFAEVHILLLLSPLYLIVASIMAERVVHPEEQKDIRKKIRQGILVVIGGAVLYFIATVFDFHMVVWSSMFGFLVFVAIVIGFLYFIITRAVT